MTEFPVKNLGEIQGPVLVFGGPYSNLQATEALLKEARNLGISTNHILCTGDVVAYAGDPAKTTDLVMNSGMHVLMGNCEESFGFESDDCGCGFDEGSACDLLSRQWYAHANAELTSDHRAWMRSLPRQIRFNMAGQRIALIHGGVDEISRWVFGSTPTTIKSDEFERVERTGAVDIVVAGHSGLPFIDDLGENLWLNAGVIGMPANDGTPRTWYMVLHPRKSAIEIELRPLSYDHVSAATQMNDLNLAGAYADTLIDGLWPNMDVMEQKERDRVGQALTPVSIEWPTSARSAAE